MTNIVQMCFGCQSNLATMTSAITGVQGLLCGLDGEQSIHGSWRFAPALPTFLA